MGSRVIYSLSEVCLDFAYTGCHNKLYKFAFFGQIGILFLFKSNNNKKKALII
jgi:hypothetical protein